MLSEFKAWWTGGSTSARTARTAWQTFAGVFGLTLLAVLQAYARPPHTFNFELLWYGGFVMGVASALAYWMNRR